MNSSASFNHRQRGEGKVGCTITLLVLIILAAAAIKVVPLYYADNQIYDIVDRKVEMAAGRHPEELTKEVMIEIRPMDIPEALRPGAIIITKSDARCTATLRYTHKVDFYGITEWSINVDKTLSHPILEGIR